MFTAAIILMEMKRPARRRITPPKITTSSPPSSDGNSQPAIRELYLPCESGEWLKVPLPPRYSKAFRPAGHQLAKDSRNRLTTSHITPANDAFDKSKQYEPNFDPMDHVGPAHRPPTSTGRSTTGTTKAIVNPVVGKILRPLRMVDVDDNARDNDEKDGKCNRKIGERGSQKAVNTIAIAAVGDDAGDKADVKAKVHMADGDYLEVLKIKISGKNDKRRHVMEQIAKLEERKRRFVRTARQNHGRIRASQRKREKLDKLAKSTVDLPWEQVFDLEKEKLVIEKMIKEQDDEATALALEKEEKSRRLLETINQASALYEKESNLLAERHQREVSRFHIVLVLFLVLSFVLIITYVSKFSSPQKPAPHGGIWS